MYTGPEKFYLSYHGNICYRLGGNTNEVITKLLQETSHNNQIFCFFWRMILDGEMLIIMGV